MTPEKIPRCEFEQSTDKTTPLLVSTGFIESLRVFSISAQIREYSIVQGYKNGATSCTNRPIILVRPHAS
uniref:CSON009317 protein n=1 Tax=Culicoides sonorensis TaxID=179676 RepID=A0A336M3S9_CULSO